MRYTRDWNDKDMRVMYWKSRTSFLEKEIAFYTSMLYIALSKEIAGRAFNYSSKNMYFRIEWLKAEIARRESGASGHMHSLFD
jgi:hypothetical protein